MPAAHIPQDSVCCIYVYFRLWKRPKLYFRYFVSLQDILIFLLGIHRYLKVKFTGRLGASSILIQKLTHAKFLISKIPNSRRKSIRIATSSWHFLLNQHPTLFIKAEADVNTCKANPNRNNPSNFATFNPFSRLSELVTSWGPSGTCQESTSSLCSCFRFLVAWTKSVQ